MNNREAETGNYWGRPHPECPFKCLKHRSTEEDPRHGSPLSASMGGVMGKDWPKRPSDRQLQEVRKKDSYRAITPAAEAVHVPATWGHQGSRTSSSCTTLTGGSTLTRAELPQAKKQKTNNLAFMHAGSLQLCLTLWDPVDCGLPGFSVREGVLQARILELLAKTGCHTLLEHYICYYPSRQPSWVSGASRTSATQVAASSPHLALTGANPVPPGHPQELNPSGDPHVEVEIKPQLKPRGSVAKEEDPELSHQLHKLQIKSTQWTKQTLCLWNI